MEKEIKIQDLISIVLRKWWMVGIFTFVFGVLFFVFSNFFVNEQFTSYGSLYVNNKAQEVVISSTIENNTANLYDLTTADLLVETYKKILSSNNFFETIKKNIDTDYSAKQLKKLVRYESIEETNVIEVYAIGGTPESACALCGAVLKYANHAIMDIVEVGSVKIIDSATLPESRSYPSVTKNTMLGMILGFVLACAIIFMMYYFDVKIKTVDDITSRCDLVVLGVIPNMYEDNTLEIRGGSRG